MFRMISVRLIQSIPVLLLVAVLSFILMHLLPGDPAVVIAGADATPAAVERIRRDLGLDLPIWQQLLSWFLNLGQGKFGSSLVLNQTVLSAVAERLPVTMSLAALSLASTLPSGIALRVREGVRAACPRPLVGAGYPRPRLPADPGHHAAVRLRLRAHQHRRRYRLHA